MPGPPPNPPRDGDKKQARQRVNVLVRTGRLAHPNDVPCVDCGHVWREGDARHEYDHHRGYAAAHHLDVQSLCTRCHTIRTDVPVPPWAHHVFAPWRPGGGLYAESHWQPPLTWSRQALAAGERRRVYCAPGVDPFAPGRPAERGRLIDLIRDTPALDWLLVTEVPATVRGFSWPANAWVGTTCERAVDLAKVAELLADPAPPVRFVKYEPAREFVAFPAYLKRLDWLIVGGDSGIDRHSPLDVRWIERAARDCAGVRALYVSQDAGATYGTQGRIPDELWAYKQFPTL